MRHHPVTGGRWDEAQASEFEDSGDDDPSRDAATEVAATAPEWYVALKPTFNVSLKQYCF